MNSVVLANSSIEKLDARILDQVLSAHSYSLSDDELKLIPNTIICQNSDNSSIEIKGLQNPSSAPLTSLERDTAIVNLSDGDQISGYMLLMKDLRNLASKKVSKIEVREFSGYWWADGDYYGFSNLSARCELKVEF